MRTALLLLCLLVASLFFLGALRVSGKGRGWRKATAIVLIAGGVYAILGAVAVLMAL